MNKYLLMLTLSCGSLYAQNDKIMQSDPGSVTCPITSNIDVEAFKTHLAESVTLSAVAQADLIEKEVAKSIEDRIAKLKVGNYASWLTDEEAIKSAIKDGVSSSVAQINNAFKKGAETYNKSVSDGARAAAETLIKNLNFLAPKMRFNGNYKYREGQRDPRTPGWSNVAVQMIPTSAGGNGNISFKVTVTITPSILANQIGSISFDVTADAKITLSGDLGYFNLNYSPENKPTTVVSAIPQMHIKGEFSAGGGTFVKISTGGYASFPTDLTKEAISGDLVAGLRK